MYYFSNDACTFTQIFSIMPTIIYNVYKNVNSLDVEVHSKETNWYKIFNFSVMRIRLKVLSTVYG